MSCDDEGGVDGGEGLSASGEPVSSITKSGAQGVLEIERKMAMVAELVASPDLLAPAPYVKRACPQRSRSQTLDLHPLGKGRSSPPPLAEEAKLAFLWEVAFGAKT